MKIMKPPWVYTHGILHFFGEISPKHLSSLFELRQGLPTLHPRVHPAFVSKGLWREQTTRGILRRRINRIITKLLILIIKFYQIVISPIFGKTCRFYPTCSEYFISSIQNRGLIKGSIMGVIRIIKCNPFNNGGHDPVIR